jgi:hypothetical protein
VGKQTQAIARVLAHENRPATFMVRILNGLALIVVNTLFGAAFCAVLISQVFFLGIEHGLGGALLACLSCVLMVVAAIAIHELGHLIAVVIVRWRVLHVVIGPFTWEKQGDRFRLRLTSRRSSSWGHVTWFPIGLRRYHLRWGICCSGGILANLLVALVCLIVLLAYHSSPNALISVEEQSVFRFFLKPDHWTMAVVQEALFMNLVYAMMNSIPHQNGKFTSDGGLLLGLLLPKEPRGAVTLLVRPGLGGTLFHGARPRKWDGEVIQQLLHSACTSLEKADAQLCAYYRALDREQLEEAGTLLEQALSSVDDLKGHVRGAILVEAAYFEGFHRRNATRARKWLHQAAIRELQEHTFLRAAAAVLLAEGLFAAAAASAETALAKAEQSLDRGAVLAEKQWLRTIRDTCREQIKANETHQPAVS